VAAKFQEGRKEEEGIFPLLASAVTACQTPDAASGPLRFEQRGSARAGSHLARARVWRGHGGRMATKQTYRCMRQSSVCCWRFERPTACLVHPTTVRLLSVLPVRYAACWRREEALRLGRPVQRQRRMQRCYRTDFSLPAAAGGGAAGWRFGGTLYRGMLACRLPAHTSRRVAAAWRREALSLSTYLGHGETAWYGLCGERAAGVRHCCALLTLYAHRPARWPAFRHRNSATLSC